MVTLGRGSLRALVVPAAALIGAFALAALLMDRLAGGVMHLGEIALLCLRAPLMLIDAALHLGAAVNAGLAAFAVLAMAVVLTRQTLQTRRIQQAIGRAKLEEVPAAIARPAEAAQVLDRVDVVSAQRPFAFVYGWLNPRICVSTEMAVLLSPEELQAALLHERWHLIKRDPARITAATAVRAGLRFLPDFGRQAERYVVSLEIAADHFAVTKMGHRKPLASALLRLEPVAVAPAFAGRTEPRVAALIDGVPPAPSRPARWPVAVLAMEIVALLLLTDARVWSSIGSVGIRIC